MEILNNSVSCNLDLALLTADTVHVLFLSCYKDDPNPVSSINSMVINCLEVSFCHMISVKKLWYLIVVTVDT